VIDSSIIETDGIIFHYVWQQKCNLLGKHGQFPIRPTLFKRNKKKLLFDVQMTIFLFKTSTFDNCTFKKDFDAQIPRCKQDKRRLENMLIFTKKKPFPY
jgi:hypothetical protein